MPSFKNLIIVVTAIFLCVPTIEAAATEINCPECIGCHTLSNQEAETLMGLDENAVKKVSVSPISGIWKISFEKDRKKSIAYMDFRKKHIINGPIYNLTAKRSEFASDRIDASRIPLSNSIVMGNRQATKKLIVFSDPDCSYCAKLHQELKKLVEKDKNVSVYIKMFPLKNVHPDAYKKAITIIEKGSLSFLEDAYADKDLPQPKGTASKEIDSTLALGEELGVHATPTLVFSNGRIMSGFMKEEEIESLMEN